MYSSLIGGQFLGGFDERSTFWNVWPSVPPPYTWGQYYVSPLLLVEVKLRLKNWLNRLSVKWWSSVSFFFLSLLVLNQGQGIHHIVLRFVAEDLEAILDLQCASVLKPSSKFVLPSAWAKKSSTDQRQEAYHFRVWYEDLDHVFWNMNVFT